MKKRAWFFSLIFACGISAAETTPTSVEPDFPPPDAVQAVPLSPNVAISWNWNPTRDMPTVQNLEFEVQRGSVTIATVTSPRYIDRNRPAGTWDYRVRARARYKGEPKKTVHFSDWSETTTASLTSICQATPDLEWEATATPPQPSSSKGPPEVRVHLAGQITLKSGCSLQQAEVFFVSPQGAQKSDNLRVDSSGRFDQMVTALDASESGDAESVDVFITVSSEAGRIKSDTVRIELLKRNKFAPTNSKF